MELRQLRYFTKVAETLNFSEASKQLFITQSTLSQQISQIETELGQPLFERNSHEVILTEAGKELLPYARKTIAMAQLCVDRIHDLEHLVCGTLNIGVTYSFSSIMTDTLISFMRKFPGVKMNITYDTMEELMGRLQSHNLDFVLAFKPSQQYEKIESHVLFNNNLAAVVNSAHPLSREKSITLAELQHYTLALPAHGMQARNTFEGITTLHDYEFNVRAEFNDVNLLLDLVRETNYVTVLSESAILGEEGVTAVRIDAPDCEMIGCVHTLKDSYVRNSAQEFFRLLSQSTALLKNSSLANLID